MHVFRLNSNLIFISLNSGARWLLVCNTRVVPAIWVRRPRSAAELYRPLVRIGAIVVQVSHSTG